MTFTTPDWLFNPRLLYYPAFLVAPYIVILGFGPVLLSFFLWEVVIPDVPWELLGVISRLHLFFSLGVLWAVYQRVVKKRDHIYGDGKMFVCFTSTVLSVIAWVFFIVAWADNVQ